MMTLMFSLLVVVTGLLAFPVAVLFTEIVAAIALPHGQTATGFEPSARCRVAVLVPAHNESLGISLTIADIQGQLYPGDRLLVVADNCTDDTAAIARAAGAEVIERHDAMRWGKGYALQAGLDFLFSDPPEFVIFIDADCRVDGGAIEQLTKAAATSGQAVQALHIMTSPDASQVNHQVSEFATRVKLYLREEGLRVLGLPCPLVGTGMAFPWELACLADFTSGSIVEDLRLGLDLTARGHPPIFCPSACVRSEFPSSIKGASTQRRRWEQGHINMIMKDAPRLFSRAMAQRNWRLLALTADLVVPPLSLLGLTVVGVFAVTASAAFLGFPRSPLIISAATLFFFMAAVLLAWIKCGRDVLPATSILLIAPYVIKKLGLYQEVLTGKADTRWTRTDRTKS